MCQTIIPCDVGGSTVGMPVLALTSTPNKFMLYRCMGDQHSLATYLSYCTLSILFHIFLQLNLLR